VVRAPAERDLIRSLLRHGARFLEPQPKVVAAADWLADLGLVELRRALLVRCANPADGDFTPLLRDCDGLIELRENVDEGGGDYRCPTRHSLPRHLQDCCRWLTEGSVAEAAQRSGLARGSIYSRMATLKRAFAAAGLDAYLDAPARHF